MLRNRDRNKLLSRRAFILGGAQVGAITLLTGRLYYLQFIKNEEYRMLSENNRVKLNLLMPPRGLLLDRNNIPMADNDKTFQLFLDGSEIRRGQLEKTIDDISVFVSLEPSQVEKVKKEWRRNRFTPLLLKEHLKWEEVARLELHQLTLPGIDIRIGSVRTYPLGEKAAHLIGYVGAVSPKELEVKDVPPLLRQPYYKIGKDGIEKTVEERVRGKAGIRQLEVNVHGQPVRELSHTESEPGEAVRLTVDSRLQRYGAELLNGESAAAIVMDITNGDVMAMISTPAFDPNIFSKGIPHDYWNELNAHVQNPLLNKALQGQYPPGSTFKMMTALAGLKSGKITPSTRVTCPGYYYLGNHRFNCWKEEGHGSVNLEDALAQSCDTYFYTVAQRAGVEAIAEICLKFGLGSTSGLRLPSEKPGLVPSEEWKQKRFGQRWMTGDTVNVGIGQGYVLTTPIQLAVMAARLATGTQVKPNILADASASRPEFPVIDLPSDYLQAVREGMEAVTEHWRGTAYWRRITDPQYAMAGKTGTSQVRRIEVQGQKQHLIPWAHRHHALFVGYAPLIKPRYAVSVIVEHGGGGSSSAAPRARDLLWKTQLLADGIEIDPQTERVEPLPVF